jgi:uncharacterized damage-inducible protein DinB
MTVIQLADHCFTGSERLRGVLRGEPGAMQARFEPSSDLRAAALRLREQKEALAQELRSLDSERLAGRVNAFGRELPLFRVIDALREHEIHHKGQLWVIARELGVEPPFFVRLA